MAQLLAVARSIDPAGVDLVDALLDLGDGRGGVGVPDEAVGPPQMVGRSPACLPSLPMLCRAIRWVGPGMRTLTVVCASTVPSEAAAVTYP